MAVDVAEEAEAAEVVDSGEEEEVEEDSEEVVEEEEVDVEASINHFNHSSQTVYPFFLTRNNYVILGECGTR